MTERLSLSPRVVLFDLDGTLVDSSRDMVSAWSEVITAARLELGDVAELHGVPARQSLARLLGPERQAELPHWVEQLLELECTQTSQTSALPGAAELLDLLQEQQVEWGVVTSCARQLARARLSATGLPIPELLVTVDDVSRGKPDPEPYLLGARLAGVSPAEALVVEDAIAGIDSGLAAGAVVAAVATTHEPAELSRAHHVLPDLPALARLLRPARRN